MSKDHDEREADRYRHFSFHGARPKPRVDASRREPGSPTLPGGPTARGEDAVGLSGFVRWVLALGGLDPEAYRPAPFRRRLPACLRALRARDVAHARTLIEADPGLLPAALGALVLGVTGFFRDPVVFQSLRARILPELCASRPAIRVWSAGCGDGAELYSVAMLLADSCAPSGDMLLGTDCRLEAIEAAEDALFDREMASGVPPGLRERYLVQDGARFRVVDALRRRCRWAVGDVLAGGPGGPWDLVLFRNVAIYLRPEAAARVWRRLAEGIVEGGVLVVGKAERPAGSSGFRRMEPCIYRRIREETMEIDHAG